MGWEGTQVSNNKTVSQDQCGILGKMEKLADDRMWKDPGRENDRQGPPDMTHSPTQVFPGVPRMTSGT